MVPVYNFRQQLAIGERCERVLDQYFAENLDYRIFKVPINLQHLGIDRVFINPKNRLEAWEYKSDIKAHETGNAFIEIAIVRENVPSPGWAYTSNANWIAYWVPGLAKVYLIHPPRLREVLPTWECYPQGVARNNGFHAVGLLVPLKQLEFVTSKILKGVTEDAVNPIARKTIPIKKPVHSRIEGPR